jgi:Zn-dependent protease
MLSVVWIIICLSISIVLHEIGHAWAARMCGFDVDAIRFGLGPTIRKWRWNYTEISIGYPMSLSMGLVEYSDRGRGTIWQRLFVAVSGVLANALLMIVANFGDTYLHRWSYYWSELGVMNLVLVCLNLVPFATAGPGGYTKQWSDGGQILGLLQEMFTGRNFTMPR